LSLELLTLASIFYMKHTFYNLRLKNELMQNVLEESNLLFPVCYGSLLVHSSIEICSWKTLSFLSFPKVKLIR